MSGKRTAIIVAATVEVQCPFCGEPQPSPDNGSHVWMTSQVSAISGQARTCVSCDEKFVVNAQSRVPVEAASP